MYIKTQDRYLSVEISGWTAISNGLFQLYMPTLFNFDSDTGVLH